jgi:hydroxyacylglutathione hydrolase
MRIAHWTGPPVDTHSYLMSDPDAGEAWVVDAPLETAEAVLKRVRQLGLRLARVVLTHGHFDHILDVERYQAAGVPVAVHPAGRGLLDAPQTAMFGLPQPMPVVRIDEPLDDGGRLRLGDADWEVGHTPGHAPGHVVLYSAARKTLMGGDMLFQGGYGRVDLPGCDPAQMAESLLRLLELPDDTKVYPGHGPTTTIGAERSWLEPALRNPRGVRL